MLNQKNKSGLHHGSSHGHKEIVRNELALVSPQSNPYISTSLAGHANSEIRATPLASRNKFAYLTFLPVSFMGFIDASYLSIKHFVGTPVPCSILRGCEEVTTSQYSVIGGIPVALLGAIYYFAIFTLISLYLSRKRYAFSGGDSTAQKNDDRLMKIAAHLTIIGILASLWFIYLQLFVIKAICLYCMFSALTSSLLFVFGVYVLKFKNKSLLVKP